MIQYGTNFGCDIATILLETNKMKKFFLVKASQISLALGRSWHKVFLFSMMFYGATYFVLHFQAASVYKQTLVTLLKNTIQAFIL
jgi:hypothetical protein